MSKSQYIPLKGGIDLVTPPAQLAPGACLSAVNYECPVTGGYKRIEGYAAVGPEVPGQGPILGATSLDERLLAVREQAERDGERWAVLFQLDDGAWRFLAEAHPGRHEWDEGNVTGTEGGRSLYGVGEGRPFVVQLPKPEASDYASTVELTGALVGELPDGVSYSATGDEIKVTDTGSRDITGVTVIGRDDSTLLTVADATGDGSTDTILDIDLTGIEPNDVAHITLTIGTANYPRRLSVPDLEMRYRVLTDAPAGAHYVVLHKNHLFLGFPAGSLQHSGVGDPEDWDAATGGAGEIGVGQAISGLSPGRGGALHVLCRDSVKTLYGTSAADWQLKVTVPNSGARPYSAQSLVQPYFIAERGISSLEATEQFGDFRPMQPGATVEPLFIEDALFTRVVASAISKQRAQYRVFFDDGTGIYMSPAGITTVRFPHQVAVAYSGELDDGNAAVRLRRRDGLPPRQRRHHLRRRRHRGLPDPGLQQPAQAEHPQALPSRLLGRALGLRRQHLDPARLRLRPPRDRHPAPRVHPVPARRRAVGRGQLGRVQLVGALARPGADERRRHRHLDQLRHLLPVVELAPRDPRLRHPLR